MKTLKKLNWLASAGLILLAGTSLVKAADSARPECHIKEGLPSGSCGDRHGHDCTIKNVSCTEACPANFDSSCRATADYEYYGGGRSKALKAAVLNCPANAVIVYHSANEVCEAAQAPEAAPAAEASSRFAAPGKLQ